MFLLEVICAVFAVIIMLFVSEDISWQPGVLVVFVIFLIIKSLGFWGKTAFKKGKGAAYYFGSVSFLVLDIIRIGALLISGTYIEEYMRVYFLRGSAIGIFAVLLQEIMILFFAVLPLYPVYSNYEDDLGGGIALGIGMQILAIISINLLTYCFTWWLVVILGVITGVSVMIFA